MAFPAASNDNTLCLYHSHCADGFTAAWAVWKKYPNWTFRAFKYGDPTPDSPEQNIVMVDCSYKRVVMEELLERARFVTVLDHYQSAVGGLDALLSENRIGGVFDMTRSGARLAWDWFHPGEEPPKLLLHVEDRDLWRFALPGTKEIHAALVSYDYTFEVWDELMLHVDPRSLMRDGLAIRRRTDKEIRERIDAAQRRMMIGGYDVPALNVPPSWASDAGHIMAQGEAFAVCYWDSADGRNFSLRSARDGKDVAKIAERYGGGGHRHAAEFYVPSP